MAYVVFAISNRYQEEEETLYRKVSLEDVPKDIMELLDSDMLYTYLSLAGGTPSEHVILGWKLHHFIARLPFCQKPSDLEIQHLIEYDDL